MKCIFVTHCPPDPLSAVYGYVDHRRKDLEDAGWKVEIWTPADFPRLRALRPSLLPLLYAPAVARRLSRSSPAPELVVCHSHSGWATALGRRILRRKRPATVIQFHGLEPLYHRAVAREFTRAGSPLPLRHRLAQATLMPLLLRIACRSADRVWCLNEAEAAFLTAKRWTTKDRVEIVPNHVPTESFPALVRDRPVRRLLFLGQWLWAKGTRYLIEAFSRLAKDDPTLELHCVGTRVSAETVLSDALPGLRGRLRVTPTIDRVAVREQLIQADVFVFPSLSEGSSLALLEAMAAALPIVATRVGAAPDLLTDGESALLVPPGDAEALASALRRVVDDGALRARLGEGAQRVASGQTWERLRAGYHQAIAEASGRPGD